MLYLNFRLHKLFCSFPFFFHINVCNSFFHTAKMVHVSYKGIPELMEFPLIKEYSFSKRNMLSTLKATHWKVKEAVLTKSNFLRFFVIFWTVIFCDCWDWSPSDKRIGKRFNIFQNFHGSFSFHWERYVSLIQSNTFCLSFRGFRSISSSHQKCSI